MLISRCSTGETIVVDKDPLMLYTAAHVVCAVHTRSGLTQEPAERSPPLLCSHPHTRLPVYSEATHLGLGIACQDSQLRYAMVFVTKLVDFSEHALPTLQAQPESVVDEPESDADAVDADTDGDPFTLRGRMLKPDTCVMGCIVQLVTSVPEPTGLSGADIADRYPPILSDFTGKQVRQCTASGASDRQTRVSLR